VRKKKKMIYKLKCTISGQVFKTTRQAPSPDDLVSVRAYYELNPDEDDRPNVIKVALENEAPAADLYQSDEEEDEEALS